MLHAQGRKQNKSETDGNLLVPALVCILVVKQLLHEEVVHCDELLLLIDGTVKLLAVMLLYTEDYIAVVGVILFHVGGQEQRVLAVVVFEGVKLFELELLAVLVLDGDVIAAVIFVRGWTSRCFIWAYCNSYA